MSKRTVSIATKLLHLYSNIYSIQSFLPLANISRRHKLLVGLDHKAVQWQEMVISQMFHSHRILLGNWNIRTFKQFFFCLVGLHFSLFHCSPVSLFPPPSLSFHPSFPCAPITLLLFPHNAPISYSIWILTHYLHWSITHPPSTATPPQSHPP